MITALTLLLAPALAQSSDQEVRLDAQHFRPSVDAEHLLWTDVSRQDDDHAVAVRSTLSYAHLPYVYHPPGQAAPQRIVTNLLQANVVGSWSYGPLRVALDVPIHLFAAGEDNGGTAGLGDVALDLKSTLLRARPEMPLGIAVSARLRAPTSTTPLPLGERSVVAEIEAIIDARLGDHVVALNVGTRMRPSNALENITLDDQLYGRLGGAWQIRPQGGLSAEVAGHLNYSSPIANPGNLVSEALVGGWFRASEDVVVQAGIGTGLTFGVGAPVARGVIRVAWEGQPGRDTDGDGFADRKDACPDTPEDVDGFEDDDGCDDVDNDADGIADADDACPLDPEDLDGVRDGDGCPEAERRVVVAIRDLDGLPLDAAAIMLPGSFQPLGHGRFQVEAAPGVLELDADAPGFPSTHASLAVPAEGGEELVVTLMAVPTLGALSVLVVDEDGSPVDAYRWRAGDIVPSGLDVSAAMAPPGSYEVVIEADGFMPTRRPAEVRVDEVTELIVQLERTTIELTTDRIELREKVLFHTAAATIQDQSHALLDQVAAILIHHPEITRVRVEGHTDVRGSESYNRRLSNARAHSVALYLEEAGVGAERLSAIGYGESMPLFDGDDPAVHEANRRVVITILERSDSPT